MSAENLLLTPGPTPVPPEALRAMAEPIIHHRTPQYRKLFESVSQDLKPVFRTKRPVYTFAGSGTLAMEAAVVNFCSPGDCVIVLEAGKFGERWRLIAERYGLNVVKLAAAYGEVISPEQVELALQKNKTAKIVYTTLCETSTASLFDIQGMAQAVGKTGAVLAVDAISGLAGDVLEMDAWGVDVVVCGSQKGLMLPPGLAFVAVSEKARPLTLKAKCPRFYTDLSQMDRALQSSDTPFTPAISLMFALRQVLNRLHREGMEKIWQRTKALAQRTRKSLQDHGYQLFSKAPSSAVTAVCIPNGIDGIKLVSTLRDQKGVTFAGGQGQVKGKIFRIAHFGYITERDIEQAIAILNQTVSEMRKSGTAAH